MKKKFFSGRVSEELWKKVEKFCKKGGMTKTELLKRAISNYLEIVIPENQDEKLSRQLARIEWNQAIIAQALLEKNQPTEQTLKHLSQIANRK